MNHDICAEGDALVQRIAADAAWDALDRELDAWRDAGATATFWWRDDDASSPTDAFRRLVDLSVRHQAPLAIAAIPAFSEAAIAPILAEAPTVSVLQHGHTHVDQSPPSQRGAAELSTDEPDEVVLERIERGRQRLSDLYGRRFHPVMVPPWNRIDEGMIEKLAQSGFKALSTFGPREEREPARGLRQINAHCDILNWKDGARFRGTSRTLDDLVEHLADRRGRRVDAAEPTGILTHHLDHDEASWAFMECLLTRLGAHPAARWVSGAAIGAER